MEYLFPLKNLSELRIYDNSLRTECDDDDDDDGNA